MPKQLYNSMPAQSANLLIVQQTNQMPAQQGNPMPHQSYTQASNSLKAKIAFMMKSREANLEGPIPAQQFRSMNFSRPVTLAKPLVQPTANQVFASTTQQAKTPQQADPMAPQQTNPMTLPQNNPMPAQHGNPMPTLVVKSKTAQNLVKQLIPILRGGVSSPPLAATAALNNVNTAVNKKELSLNISKSNIPTVSGNQNWPALFRFEKLLTITDLLRKGLNFDQETLGMQDRLRKLHKNTRSPPPCCSCIKYGQSKCFFVTIACLSARIFPGGSKHRDFQIY